MAELEKFIETDADNETVDVNGKLNFPKNQHVTENNYAVNLNNSDIWKANSVWFADKTSNEGLIFPRSDGKWDSLGVLDGQIKLRTGVTMGMGESPSGGTTQVIADYPIEQGEEAEWIWEKSANGKFEAWFLKNYGTINFDTAVISSRLYRNSSYYPLDIYLPFEIINIDHVSGGWKNSSWAIWSIYNMSTFARVYVGNLTNGSISSNELNLYVHGTWK